MVNSFYFVVTIDTDVVVVPRIAGLSTDIEVVEQVTQTVTLGTRQYVKSVGSFKWEDITFERQPDNNLTLARWARTVMEGGVASARKDVHISLNDGTGAVVQQWQLRQGWPKSYKLSGARGSIPTERLVAVHEGLRGPL